MEEERVEERAAEAAEEVPEEEAAEAAEEVAGAEVAAGAGSGARLAGVAVVVAVVADRCAPVPERRLGPRARSSSPASRRARAAPPGACGPRREPP